MARLTTKNVVIFREKQSANCEGSVLSEIRSEGNVWKIKSESGTDKY